jgi:predicted transcriptional regulator
MVKNFLLRLKKVINKFSKEKSLSFVNKRPLNLQATNTLEDAMEAFLINSVNIVAILSDKKIIGTLSKPEAIKLINKKGYKKVKNKKLLEIRDRKFLKTTDKKNLGEITSLLINNNAEAVAIVNKKDKFLGLVDYYDIIRMFLNSEFIIENPPIVNKAMKINIRTIIAQASINNLINKIAMEKIKHSLVIKENSVKGIITIKDIISQIYKEANLDNTTVEAAMTPRIVYIEPGKPINKAMEICLEKRFNQLPVKANKKIVGIVTIKDLVKAYYNFLKLLESDKTNFLVLPIEYQQWTS